MEFSDKLTGWYFINKRDLPWRETKDAYKIWVSEIILQQTRVEQGLSYYKRFIQRYPDVFVLASANEGDLLKLWQGLGYYSRVRNMHMAAKEIVVKYNGVIPDSYDEIIRLKGIGKYTAAAILSFAYDLPYAVLDGNVKRVLSRFFCIEQDIKSPSTEKLIFEKLNRLFDKNRSSDFNQAIMEFGALYCKVSNPDCPKCIFIKECKAYKKNKVSILPLVSKKTQPKIRHFYYVVPVIKMKGGYYTYLIKREDDDIWKHLFQFPLIETEKALSRKQLLDSQSFKRLIGNARYDEIGFSKKFVHKLSHQVINAVFVQIGISSGLKDKKLKKVRVDDLHKYPVSRLTENYLKKTGL
ncbi:MAG TPA: A/G-specific adenine glycosylase [Bacteroidales bacterium]|nr:A/G-specific adenine glycosylase [Bacteroidales bacterium]